VTAHEDNPEERCARREMRKLMSDAIMQLAPEMRQVCLLRDILQYSTQEVAEQLGISTMAVRLRLFRARRRLREKLSLALQPSKHQPLRAAPGQMPRRLAQRNYDKRVPLPSFVQCACGD
jgi:predicted RNA polymerase sigma factor